MSDWTLLCDFDGTISVEDTTDTLLERFGKPGWEVLETEWRAGRIGSRDCMAGQVALLDMDRAELDAHLAERGMDPAFADFVRDAQAQGMHVEILSDGLDYAIRTILARDALDHLPITANRLEAAGDRAGASHFRMRIRPASRRAAPASARARRGFRARRRLPPGSGKNAC